MYRCSYCRGIFTTYHSLLKHSTIHENSGHFVLPCGFSSCPKQYTSIRALSVHLRKVHKYFVTRHREPDQANRNDNRDNIADDPLDDQGFGDCQALDLNELGEQDEGDREIDQANFDHDMKCNVGKLLLGLRENHHLTSKSVAVVAQKMTEVIELNNEAIKRKISEYIQRTEIAANDKESLLHMINDDCRVAQHIKGLDSQQKLERFAKSELKVVTPTEYILGHDHKGNPETLQYVSMKDTIISLLSCQEIKKSVSQNRRTAQKIILTDVTDGEHFLQHHLAPNENVVSIILYVDEFTLTNPLRSQAKRYKILATYFQIANLPADKRSKLDSIYLSSLCKTEHAKKYGMPAIYQWLVEELTSLTNEGIDIEGTNFKCMLLTCVADNLGAHQIGGFLESFSSNHPCRFCTVSKDDMHGGNTGVLRTPVEHDAHVERVTHAPNLASVYGLKGPSFLAEVPYFHCTEGLPSDIAHDLFEGTVKDVLSRMIKEFVQQRYFAIDNFNTILAKFAFTGTDKVNTPSPIPADGNIKQTICKMWCLFRLLPLMIGDRVPPGDRTWQFYLQLRSIVEYLTAKRLKRGQVEVLRDLIDDYMLERLSLWPEVPIKPKEHYMLHYPDQIIKFGPLSHLWTLRFENKHQQFLQIWQPIRCSKNVCKTLATRHQYQSALAFDSGCSRVDLVSIVNMKTQKLRDVPPYVRNVMSDLVQDPEKEVVLGSGLMVNKVVYSKGTIVITDIANDEIEFAEVRHATFCNNRYYVICQELNTELFSAHYHAYIVTRKSRVILLEKSQLSDESALALYNIPNSPDLAVVLKYKLVQA